MWAVEIQSYHLEVYFHSARCHVHYKYQYIFSWLFNKRGGGVKRGTTENKLGQRLGWNVNSGPPD